MSGSIDSRKWYDQKRWILPALLLFPPLGIPLLWRTSWARPLKITGTVFSSLLLLSAMVDGSAQQASETLASAPIVSPTPVASAPIVSPTPVASAAIASPTLVASAPIASPTPTPANPFNFPRSTCGDAAAQDATWHPVFVDGGDLQAVRSQYCADAVAAVREETGVETIQLASFTQRDRAEAFAQAVKGEVGRPTVPDAAPEPIASAPIEAETPDPIAPASPAESSQCDPAYPDLCLPLNSGDLDCKDVAANNFQVLPPDPHGFDRDRDGVGCES